MSRESLKIALRLVLSGISVVGVVMLIRMLLMASSGELASRLLPSTELQQAWWCTVLALGIGLPVPLHVISIGMILQKRWLSPAMARVAWIAIITSGCWLGVAIVVKVLLR